MLFYVVSSPNGSSVSSSVLFYQAQLSLIKIHLICDILQRHSLLSIYFHTSPFGIRSSKLRAYSKFIVLRLHMGLCLPLSTGEHGSGQPIKEKGPEKVVPYTLVRRGVPGREDTYPEPSACEEWWPVPFVAAFISPVLPPGTHLLLGK